MDEKPKQEIKSSRSSRIPCSTSPTRNAGCQDSSETRPPPRIKNYPGIFSPKPSTDDVPPVQKFDIHEHLNVGTQASESLIASETGCPPPSVRNAKEKTNEILQNTANAHSQLSGKNSSPNSIQLNKRAENEKLNQTEKISQIKKTRLSRDEAFQGRGGDRHRNSSRRGTKISPVKDLTLKKPRSLTLVQKCFRKPANSASDNFPRISKFTESTGKDDKIVTKKNEKRRKSNVSTDKSSKSKPRRHSSKLESKRRTESTTSFLKLRSRGDLNSDEENTKDLVMQEKSYLHLGRRTSRLERARSRESGFSSESDEESLWDRPRTSRYRTVQENRGHGPIGERNYRWKYSSLPKSAPSSTNTPPLYSSTAEHFFRPKTSTSRESYKYMRPGRERRLSYSPPPEALKSSLKTTTTSSPDSHRLNSPESRRDDIRTRRRQNIKTGIPLHQRERILRQPSSLSRHLSRHCSRIYRSRSRTQYSRRDHFRTPYTDGSAEEAQQELPKPVENISYQQTCKTYPISSSSDELETYEGAPIKTYPSRFLRKQPRIRVARRPCQPCGVRKSNRSRGNHVLGEYSIPAAIFFNPHPRRPRAMDRSPDRTYSVTYPRFPAEAVGPFGMTIEVNDSLDDINQQVTPEMWEPPKKFAGDSDFLRNTERWDGPLESLPRPPFRTYVENESIKNLEPKKTTDVGQSSGTDIIKRAHPLEGTHRQDGSTSLKRTEIGVQEHKRDLQSDAETLTSQGNWIFPQNPPPDVSPAPSQPTLIAGDKTNLETPPISKEKTAAAPNDKDVGDHVRSADGNVRVKSDSALLETIMRMHNEDPDVKTEVMKPKPKTAVQPNRKVKPIVFPSLFTRAGSLSVQESNAISSVMRKSSVTSTGIYLPTTKFMRRPAPGRSPPPGCSSSFSAGPGNNPKDTRLRSLSLSPTPRKSVFTASRISFRGKTPIYRKRISASSAKVTGGVGKSSTEQHIQTSKSGSRPTSPKNGRKISIEMPGIETQTETREPLKTVDKSTEPDINLEGEQKREVAIQPSLVEMKTVSSTTQDLREEPRLPQQASPVSKKSPDIQQKQSQRKRSLSLEGRMNRGEDARKLLRVTDVHRTSRSSSSPSPRNSVLRAKEAGEEREIFQYDNQKGRTKAHPVTLQPETKPSEQDYVKGMRDCRNTASVKRDQAPLLTKPVESLSIDQIPHERQINQEDISDIRRPSLSWKTIPIFNVKTDKEINARPSSTNHRRLSPPVQEVDETRNEAPLRNRSSPEGVKRNLSPAASTNDRRSIDQEKRYWVDNLSEQRTPSPSYFDKKAETQQERRTSRSERENSRSSKPNSFKLAEKKTQVLRENRGPPYFEEDEPLQHPETQSKSTPDRTSNRVIDDKTRESRIPQISIRSNEVPQKKSSSSQGQPNSFATVRSGCKNSLSVETNDSRHLQPDRPRLRHLSPQEPPQDFRSAEQKQDTAKTNSPGREASPTNFHASKQIQTERNIESRRSSVGRDRRANVAFDLPEDSQTSKHAPVEGRAKCDSGIESHHSVKPKEMEVEESRNSRTRSTKEPSRHTLTSIEVTESEMNALKHRHLAKTRDEGELKIHTSKKEKKMIEERTPKREDDAHQYASRKTDVSSRSILDQKKCRSPYELVSSHPISQKQSDINDVTIEQQPPELEHFNRRPSTNHNRDSSSAKIRDDRLKKDKADDEFNSVVFGERSSKEKFPERTWSPKEWKENVEEVRRLIKEQKRLSNRGSTCNVEKDKCCRLKKSALKGNEVEETCENKKNQSFNNKRDLSQKVEEIPNEGKKKGSGSEDESSRSKGSETTLEKLQRFTEWNPGDEKSPKMQLVSKSRCGPCSTRKSRDKRSTENGVIESLFGINVAFAVDDITKNRKELGGNNKDELRSAPASELHQDSHQSQMSIDQLLQKGVLPTESTSNTATPSTIEERILIEKLQDGTCEPRNREQFILENGVLLQLKLEKLRRQQQIDSLEKLSKLTFEEALIQAEFNRRDKIRALAACKERSDRTKLSWRTSPPFPGFTAKSESYSKRSIDDILKEERFTHKQPNTRFSNDDRVNGSKRSVDEVLKAEVKVPSQRFVQVSEKLEQKVESKRSLNEGLKALMKPSLGKIPEVENVVHVKAQNQLELTNNSTKKQRNCQKCVSSVKPKSPFEKKPSGKPQPNATLKITPSPSQLVKRAQKIPNPKAHIDLPIPKPKPPAVHATLDCLFSEILPMRLDRLRTKSDNFVSKLKKGNKIGKMGKRKAVGRASV